MSLWGPGEPVTPAKGLLLCGCEESRPYTARYSSASWAAKNADFMRHHSTQVANYFKNITNPEEPNKVKLLANLASRLWMSPPGSTTELSCSLGESWFFASGGPLGASMPLPSQMFISAMHLFLLQSFLGEIPNLSLTLYATHLLLTPISKWEVDHSTWKSHRHFKLHFSPAPPSTPALSQANTYLEMDSGFAQQSCPPLHLSIRIEVPLTVSSEYFGNYTFYKVLKVLQLILSLCLSYLPTVQPLSGHQLPH